ncbi:MAG: TetR/AcrR family transcriptional regulator [Defluviitaleaceae bacterium]|nr:TetR/AcrR family transcriptional regulator [Defluviitaleaceae bacterium]
MKARARREREKQNMRVSILEATAKIIIQEGYDKLSMRKIADEIEYTPTTLYNYYKDKAQIIEEIAKDVYMKVVADIKEILQNNKNLTLDKQLKLSFIVFIKTMTDNAEMGKAVMRSGTETIFGAGETSEPNTNKGIHMLHGLLQEGQEQAIFRKLDENVSWMLITALLGFSMNAIENQLYLNENWDDLVETYVDILTNGIMSIK